MRREHVVPCDLIVRQALCLIRDGANDDAISDMIKHNCRIALVLPHEADALDSCFKNVMLEGWKWGDNVYQRLEACNIPWLEYGLEYDHDRYGDVDSVREMATTVSKRKRLVQMARELAKADADKERKRNKFEFLAEQCRHQSNREELD